MSFTRRVITFLPVSLISIAMIGCGSCDERAMQLGENGNLQFYYEPADLDTEFNRPLATGSILKMYVVDLDTNPTQNIISVKSSSPETLLVQRNNSAQNAIHLTGERQGTAKITVQAKTSKGQEEDIFPFEVADARQISLKHTCTDGANAAYPIKSPVNLKFNRKNQDRTLVGESKSCSVQVEPAEIQPSTRCDEIAFKLPAFDSVGSVRVTSDLDNGRGSKDQLGVQIVNRDIIDFLPIDQHLSEDFSTDVTIFAETMTEPHWPVCHNFAMSILIITPNICSGGDSSENEFTVKPSDQNTFSLRGIRRGECYFSVIFPEIDPNEEWEFSIPVHP